MLACQSEDLQLTAKHQSTGGQPISAPVSKTVGGPNAVQTKKARVRAQKLLRKIVAAHQEGRTKKVGHLTKIYLQSYDAKLVATERAYRAVQKHLRPDPALIPLIAKGLNPWQGTTEKAILYFKEKPHQPHHFRPIHSFRIEHRALQYLARPLLKIRADLNSNQYTLKGVHEAIKRVAGLMADGHQWAIETDITNCFGSFDGHKVANLLPLPKQVTNNSLIAETLSIEYTPYWATYFGPVSNDVDQFLQPELADARQGLPQGSATSTLIAEMLLAPIFSQLPAGAIAVGYADNILVMAKTEEEVVSVTLALWSALKAHPAGQLRPKEPKIFEPGDPIEFLGHQMERWGGTIRIQPTAQNMAEFHGRLNEDLRHLMKSTKHAAVSEHKARSIESYVRSWTAAFKLCAGIQNCRAAALSRIQYAKGGYYIPYKSHLG
jgi:hypothetical protein